MAYFDKDFYLAMLRTSRAAGTSMIPKWKCAWLMAIVYTFGNNESFTFSPRFQCDRIYIQETYGIDGGCTPDAEFSQMLKEYVAKCEAVKDKEDPFFVECFNFIMDRYNFKLIV